ncbi:hypothetical protein KBJ98_01140 [Flavobacterium sp. F-328]|uniref:Uncharacterized protein n=1 Tax=Flavobacterium erciyesense TaxID=2825842 RepID=A0ABS5CZW7_9FLAO|nr:hypothetical protein [Flavobacterium erciyesense]MBQ0907301.1 hypothetical protein [Flavobacterium erciyesense]
MKKMIFTALAVVAFSGAAMANTGEVKEDVVFSNENKVEAAVVQGPGDNEGTATPCQESAIIIYESIVKDGPDRPDLLNALMGLCML